MLAICVWGQGSSVRATCIFCLLFSSNFSLKNLLAYSYTFMYVRGWRVGALERHVATLLDQWLLHFTQFCFLCFVFWQQQLHFNANVTQFEDTSSCYQLFVCTNVHTGIYICSEFCFGAHS